MNQMLRTFYSFLLLLMLPLIMSCGGTGKKHYVIAVSQCSEDVWREKLNEELRIAALYYNNVDLQIKSAHDDVKLQTEQINSFVDEGVDLLIVAPGQVTISTASGHSHQRRTYSRTVRTAYVVACHRTPTGI